MTLKEVRLVRVLIWVLLYLVILFVLIFAVVIPAVKEYREVNRSFVQAKANFLAAEQEHDDILDRLKLLQQKHRKVIGAFENRWNQDMFVQSAGQFFQKVDLKQLDVNLSDPHFRIYELNAMTKMESPQNFYRFLDSLSTIPYVIQADFPIAFKSNGKEIEGVFRIRVYEEKIAKERSYKAPQSLDSNSTSAPME